MVSAAQRIRQSVELKNSTLYKTFKAYVDGTITTRFMKSNGTPINIDVLNIPSGIGLQSFMDMLRGEGFSVDYICDDRPCSTPYVKVVLPPANN